MTENERYYSRDYDEEFYIFDSQILTEKEFDEKNEFEDYSLFADSLTQQEVVDLLNENEQLKKENEQLKKDINKWIVDYNGLNAEYEWLKEENKHLKQRNKRQYNQLTELWSLIEAKDWETLTEMVKQMEEDDERLQEEEWECYE